MTSEGAASPPGREDCGTRSDRRWFWRRCPGGSVGGLAMSSRVRRDRPTRWARRAMPHDGGGSGELVQQPSASSSRAQELSYGQDCRTICRFSPIAIVRAELWPGTWQQCDRLRLARTNEDNEGLLSAAPAISRREVLVGIHAALSQTTAYSQGRRSHSVQASGNRWSKSANVGVGPTGQRDPVFLAGKCREGGGCGAREIAAKERAARQ